MVNVRKYDDGDVGEMIEIWNEVVRDGVAFPQEECLTAESRSGIFCIAELLRSCTGGRKNRRALHSAPEQRRQMRTHLKRKLCGFVIYERKARRRGTR